MSERNERTLTEAGEARDERKKLDADGTHGEVSTWARPALWMLGVDPQTTGLWIAPSERRMLAILTSTVLIPVSMAFCGMVMILSGQSFLAVAFFGAGVWSMMVFTIDRLMLATGMRSKCGAEPDRAQRVRLVNVSGFAVRIALAVLMSFAVTTPIKLWFFEGLVDNHIETTQKIEQDKSAAQASARAAQLVKGDLTLATMKKTIIEAQEAIQKERASVEGHQRFYQVRLDEALKENRTLCLRRCKQAKRMAAEYKKNSLDPAIARLEAAKATHIQAQKARDAHLAKLGQDVEKLKGDAAAQQQRLAESSRRDLVVRLRVLLHLSREDDLVRLASLVFWGLFLLLELAPLLAKLGLSFTLEDRLAHEHLSQTEANRNERERRAELRALHRANSMHEHARTLIEEREKLLAEFKKVRHEDHLHYETVTEMYDRRWLADFADVLRLDVNELTEHIKRRDDEFSALIGGDESDRFDQELAEAVTAASTANV